MNRRNALTISLAAGLAMIAGAVAATKSIQLGHPGTPAQPTSSLVAKRTSALDRAEARLHAAVARKPPKLPPLPAAVPSPAAGAVPGRQATPRVVYVRPAPRLVTIHRADDEHEDDDGAEGEEGDFDD